MRLERNSHRTGPWFVCLEKFFTPSHNFRTFGTEMSVLIKVAQRVIELQEMERGLIRSSSYGARLVTTAIEKQELDPMLVTDFIRPAEIKWTSWFLLVSKDTEIFTSASNIAGWMHLQYEVCSYASHESIYQLNWTPYDFWTLAGITRDFCVLIVKENFDQTAFIPPQVLYQYMLHANPNEKTPVTLQRTMDFLLLKVKRQFAFEYFDEIIA